MGLTKFAIKLAIKQKKIEEYDDFLFIGPHPDDIEIGAGATISKLSQMGKNITLLICTDGRYGKENCQELTTEQLIDVRKKESIKSANFLGVTKILFLNLEDGNQYEYDRLVKEIAKVINNIKPQIIFAPDPDVISETHLDHLNVGKACKELANFASYPEIFAHYLDGETANEKINIEAIALYMTAKPNIYVKTTKHYKKQIEALSMHTSQYPQNSNAFKSVTLYLKLRSIEFGLKKFKRACEGFRILNKTTMHCLPEIGE